MIVLGGLTEERPPQDSRQHAVVVPWSKRIIHAQRRPSVITWDLPGATNSRACKVALKLHNVIPY